MRLNIILALLFVCGYSYAQSTGDFRSKATGNWNALTSWETYNAGTGLWSNATSYPGQVTAGSNVSISNGHTITINVAPPQNIGNLTVGGGASGLLTGDGAIQLLTIGGNLVVSANATFNATSKNITVLGSTLVNGTLLDNNNNGTNIFTGLVTISNTGSFTTNNNSPYTFGTGITNSGTFTKAGNGAVTFSGNSTITANSLISITGNITAAANLTFSGSSGISIASNLNIIGGLVIDNGTTLTLGAGSFYVTGATQINGNFRDNNNNGTNTFNGALNVGVTGSLSTANSSPFVFNGAIVNDGVFNKLGTGTVAISGSLTISVNEPMLIAGNTTANANLTISGIRAITFNNNLSVAGNLLVDNGAELIINTGATTITGTTVINGSFLDNNAAGANRFVGLLTIGASGSWNTASITNTSDLRIQGGLANNNTNASQVQISRICFDGSNQSINSVVPLTMGDVRLGNAAGDPLYTYTFNFDLTLSNITYPNTTGGLYFTKGICQMASGYSLLTDLNASGASSTLGWIVGSHKITIPVGNITRTFHLGTTVYTPVTVTLSAVSVAGVFGVNYVTGDHPDISTSCLDPNKSLNRYLSFTNTTTLSSYAATISFTAAELDAGVVTSSLIGGFYNGTNWVYPRASGQSATQIVLNNIKSEGFAVVAQQAASPVIPGDPSTFGNGVWNAYAYNNSITLPNFRGYFTSGVSAIDTRQNDIIGNVTDPVSLVPTYLGCPVQQDNFFISFKRTNFTSGAYQIDLNGHDDGVQIYRNGVNIFTNNGATAIPEVNVWTGTINSTDEIELRWQEGNGNHFVAFDFTPITPSAFLPGLIEGSQSVCTGEIPQKPIVQATPPSGGCTIIPTGYQWQYSYDNVIWNDISGANTIGYTLVAPHTVDTWYRRGVVDACGNSEYTNAIKITIDNVVYGDPTVFGNNIWNVYAYKDNSYTNYAGYYTEPLLSFNTTDQYSSALSPAFGNGYLGCTVPVDNFSASMKRTGFTAGVYQIDMLNVDDNGYLYIDGNLVASRGCCTSYLNVWTGPLSASSDLELRWREGGGSARIGLTFTPVTPTPITSGVIGNNQTVCRGDIPVPISELTAPTGGCTIDSYKWQYSTNAGVSWIDLASSNSSTYTPTQTIFTSTMYRRIVYDVCGQSAVSLPITVEINNAIPGDPTAYGVNTWKAYVYDDAVWGIYTGYYEEPLLSFDTRDRYCGSCPPSAASGFQGCQNTTNLSSVKFLRQGVPVDGYYKIDLINDDDAYLYINGTLVASYVNNCCTWKYDVWTGYLDASSQIEFRYMNGTSGPGYLNNVFTYLGITPPTTLDPGIINAPVAYCVNDVPSITSDVLASGACYPLYQWEYSIDNATWDEVTGATSSNFTGIVALQAGNNYFRRKATDVCSNGPVYSNIVNVMPSGGPAGDPATYPVGVWNAYVYNSANRNSPVNYVGYYSTLGEGFDSRNSYSMTSAPSTTLGYIGCQSGNTNYTVSYKRQNFPTNTYQIDIPFHDDGVTLYIDDVQVFNNNACCIVENNVWTGTLSNTSKVELRYSNNGGNGGGALSFTPVTPAGLTSSGSISSNQSICSGTVPVALSSTSSAVSGCYVYYQWQFDTGSGFTDISGAVSATYAPSALAQTTIFRRKAIDACNNIGYSNQVTISVYAALNPGNIGTSQTICNGTNILLSELAAPSGGSGSYTYQWQSSIDNVTFNNIASATSATYSTPLLSANTWYRRNVSSCASSISTQVVAISVAPATAVSSQPTNFSVCAGGNATFAVTAVGRGLTYRWQLNTGTGFNNISNGGIYSGATTSILNIVGVTAGMNNYAYRCIITSTCTPNTVTSTNAVLTIGGPLITLQPLNSAVCAGNNQTFTVIGTGSGLTYQWQTSTDGVTYSNLSESGIFSGVNTSILTLTNTPISENNNRFRCVVISSCGSTNSNGGILTVLNPIANNVISTSNSSVCAPFNPPVINVNTPLSGGTGTYTYQWQIDNGTGYTDISAATSSTYNPPVINQTTSYRRTVTSGACSTNSNPLTINVVTAIVITSQPTNSSICPGGNTTFSVSALSGSGYQWQVSTDNGFNYSNIIDGGMYANATTSVLSITGATLAMNGYRYRCTIIGSGSCANTNSNGAVLTTNNLANITLQPTDRNTCANLNPTLSLTATGIGLSYQWQINTGGGFFNIGINTVMTGYTTNMLTFTNIPTSYNGYTFRCNVSSSCGGTVTSNVVTVSVLPAIATNSVSSPQSICSGEAPDTLKGSLPTGGDGSYAYQWQNTNLSGTYVDISGATSINYAPTILTSNTNFRRRVTSSVCAANSSSGILMSVGAATSINTHPANANVCAGTNATFTVAATGIPPSYQWQVSTDVGSTWVNISNSLQYSGFTTPTLTVITPNAAKNGYQFRCVVSGNCAPVSIASNAAILNISPSPVITTQPANTTVCEDASTSFTVVATGTPLTYQWQSRIGSAPFTNISDGGSYAGTATNSLQINPVSANLAGRQYMCVITLNSCSINTNPAVLGINIKPQITIHPTDKMICANTSTTYNISAVGAGLSYRWQQNVSGTWTSLNNGAPFSGVFTNVLGISSVPLNYSGREYRMLLSGTCTPNAVSNPALITVNNSGYWVGATSSDWNTNANWCGGTPTNTTDVIIPSSALNMPIINSSGAITKDLTIGSLASLTINGTNTLGINGDFTNNGTFNENISTVTFTNVSVPQVIKGTSKVTFHNLVNSNQSPTGLSLSTPVNLKGTMTLGANTKFFSNGALTFISSSTQTGRLAAVPSTATFTGEIAMQRYIPAKRGVRYIASPVSGATISQLKDSIIIPGPLSGGFDTPYISISTFRNYQENRSTTDVNRGFVSATTASQNLVPGIGYSVAVQGKRTTVYPNEEPVVLQVKGVPAIGQKNVNLSYTASGIKGWNFIGNPYPSQIDWESASILKTNIDDALYVWDATVSGTGQYYSYVNGISTPNKANPSIIPSMCGFFVKANGVGASVTFTESAKTASNAFNTFKKAQIEDLVRIKVVATNFSDEAVLYFNESATTSLDTKFDALKMPNNDLNVFTTLNNHKLSINAINSISEFKIPLVIGMKTKGDFEISFPELKLSGWSSVYLYDNYKKIYFQILEGNSYIATQNSDAASYSEDRFVLTNKIGTTDVVSNLDNLTLTNVLLDCYPNPINTEILKLNIGDFTSSTVVIDICTVDGRKVYTGVHSHNSTVYIDVFKNLSTGIYVLKAMDLNVSKQIQIAKVN